MKLKKSNLFLTATVTTFAIFTLHASADQTRSATADTLDQAAAWVTTTLPTTADVALWEASSTLANTMGANTTWGGLNVSAASGPVSIGGANTLLLDHSTDLNTVFNTGATTFTWGADATTGIFNIAGAAGSTSSTAQGATFSGSGLVTLSSTGTKNWSNVATTNGMTNVSFTGTLALRGASIPAIGSLSGNWLAFGGGGGAASDPGTLTQAGAFSLDTGNASTCGSFILTHAFNGQFLKLNSLQGTGSIRTDWGVSAGNQTRGIELDQATDTVFSGSILAINNQGQRRDIAIVKKGAGKLTLTGGLGTSTTGAASLNFDVQAGAIQLGDGVTNPIYVNPTGWDQASTFNLASGAKFIFATSANFTWSHRITSGTGTVDINAAGNVAFSANNSGFGGDVNLISGSLSMGPNLGTGKLTVKNGTFISSGLSGTNGTSQVGALALEDSTESDYRLGLVNDKIVVTGAVTPPASGTHSIKIVGNPTSGGTIKLIDYGGTALTPSQFSRFSLGILPGGTASFSLVNNTAETSIDLLITLEDQIWKGPTNGNWNTSTPNWALASTPGTPAVFSQDSPVVFNDTATRYAVVVDAFGVIPLNVTFNNSANAYTLTGGEIRGNTPLVKNGTAAVTLSQDNSYTGGTIVNAGTLVYNGVLNSSSGGSKVQGGKLQIGSGGTQGDIGSGPVVVNAGATLEFNRSNITPSTPDLNYKTNVKLRDVSGAGNIVLTGGAMLFNYTGSTLGFADANSWAGFSGNLTVKGGSEFLTVRNGATAMGTGGVILGDGASSGSLSQTEGNWTWTNNISLVGTNNKILNRGTGSSRTLKLQGVISGSGGLTFEDPAGSMTVTNRGYILTGANTMSGTLTIAAGVPLRVGGVPGNTNVDQSNADAFGSLGTAAVVNNGTLTFSRTGTHSVPNAISGSGAVRIGIPLADGFGDTSTQVVTLSGANSYMGATTVANSTLAVNGTALPNAGSLVLETGAVVVPTGTEVVDTLFIGGIQQASGTWGATGSGATHINNTYFSGTAGVVSVTTGGAAIDYDTWLSLYTFGVGADTSPTGDPDNDGLLNQDEYAFGLDPTSGASVSPITLGLNKTAGTFTYTRRDDALTALTYKVWTSVDLAVWTEDTGATQNDSAGPNGQGVEPVVVKLSASAPLTAPKLFVRVAAE